MVESVPKPTAKTAPGVTRRFFMTGTALVATVPLLRVADGAVTQAHAAESSADNVDIHLTVNGAEYRLALDPRTSLLDTLRDHIGLTGAKKGCDHGQCGA